MLTGYFSLLGLRGDGSLEILQKAKATGARTFFDTGWDPEEWAGAAASEVLSMLPHVDVFLPNESEAFALHWRDRRSCSGGCPDEPLRRLGGGQAGLAPPVPR